MSGMSSPSPLHRLATQNFDERPTNADRVSHFWASQNTPLGSQAQSFENPIFTFGCFSLKAVYNPCKLQRILIVAKFLFMYSFTTLLFRHLPTEIFIFINVCYPIQCFSGDSFSFFSEQVPIIFHLLSWFHVQFKQGNPRHYNILNSTFETIYQVPRK